MKKWFMLIILIAALGLPGLSFGAGTITETFEEYTGTNTSVLILSFTADASGALSVSTTATANTFTYGKLLYEVTTTPDDTSPCTTLYDVSINTSLGNDIMGGTLLDRSATATERAIPLIATSTYRPAIVTTALTVVITNNSVANGKGVIRLYFRR